MRLTVAPGTVIPYQAFFTEDACPRHIFLNSGVDMKVLPADWKASPKMFLDISLDIQKNRYYRSSTSAFNPKLHVISSKASASYLALTFPWHQLMRTMKTAYLLGK